MKAILFVCLISTSMMVNATDAPYDEELIVYTDSPFFLDFQTFQACTNFCGGVCYASLSNCVKGYCNSPIGLNC